jgi:hypothetical protein
VKASEYFWGDVYHAHWIIDSVKQGELLDKDAYHSFVNHEKSIRKLKFARNKNPYTLTEAFKVFELGLENIDSSYGATFWIKIERDEVIPNRTAESMRGFWKAHSRNGLELFIRSSSESKVRYSHFCKNIPEVKTTAISAST